MTKETDDKYQGWANRETWIANLWLTNDEALYRKALTITKQNGLIEAGDKLSGLVDDLVEARLEGAGLVMDLVNASLSRVDWREIVKSLAES